jgi:hypothetical protein
MSADAKRALTELMREAEYQEFMQHIRTKLSLSAAEVEVAYMRYSSQSMLIGNDIYEDVGTHVAMWIEYQVKGGLHARRQDAVLQLVTKHKPERIADIGFGAPTRYVRDYVLRTPGAQAHLFDKYDSAIMVGQAVLSRWCESYGERVEFVRYDMDVDRPVANFDCYLLLDAIEHCRSPASYLARTVAAASREALFLLHIPIGRLIPSHYVAWDSERAATRWLVRAGLDVLDTEMISPNPAVDHFARVHDALENLFVVARRKRT